MLNNIFLFGRVVFFLHSKIDDDRVDRQIWSVFWTTRPDEKHKKGLAILGWPSWF